MMTTILTSASYVTDELRAEFGLLPPAFLPVGHQRLYELQASVLGGRVYLTLPSSFRIPDPDAQKLQALDLEIIRVPDGLSLAESLLYALNVIGHTADSLRILHGDTLIYDPPETVSSVVAVAAQPEAYSWGLAPNQRGRLSQGGDNQVLAGFFFFSSGVAFRRALSRACGDFVEAVNIYGETTDLLSMKVEHWLDFGHLQTYYRSRCAVRTQRAFNTLSISFQSVVKRSLDSFKLAAEAHWYQRLPDKLRLYVPNFLGSFQEAGDAAYSIEYLPIPSLHELYVFSELGANQWSRILGSCREFLLLSATFAESHDPLRPIRALTLEKTLSRLEQYSKATGFPVTKELSYDGQPVPSLVGIAEETFKCVDAETERYLGVMHGDFCFTNVFFDFRTQRIKVIDPRGTVGTGHHTVYGDIRYDIAKLSHSIVGCYDFILTDRYSCEVSANLDFHIRFPETNARRILSDSLASFEVLGLGLSSPEILALVIHLFLSMTPLHSDNPKRQRAFIANALRLYCTWRKL